MLNNKDIVIKFDQKRDLIYKINKVFFQSTCFLCSLHIAKNIIDKMQKFPIIILKLKHEH